MSDMDRSRFLAQRRIINFMVASKRKKYGVWECGELGYCVPWKSFKGTSEVWQARWYDTLDKLNDIPDVTDVTP